MVDFLDGAIQGGTQRPARYSDGVGGGVSARYGVFLDGVQQGVGATIDPIGVLAQNFALTYSTNTTSTASITTASAPVSTAGLLMFTQAVTPIDAGSTIVITLRPNSDRSTASNYAYTLFDGTTLIGTCGHAANGGQGKTDGARWVLPATDTSSRTYTVRGGTNVGTAYFNGDTIDSTPFGDTLETTLIIEEFSP